MGEPSGPGERAEGMFARLHRDVSTLEQLKLDSEDRYAKLERKQRALAERMDRWGEEFADLMDRLVQRLTSSAQQLVRVDSALNEIAEQHPGSEPGIAALRADLREEARRLSEHVDLMDQAAYRVNGLEPDKPATPRIPYDRALRWRLHGLAAAALVASGALWLATLLPFPHAATDFSELLARALAAFTCGVVAVHGMLRRRVHAPGGR